MTDENTGKVTGEAQAAAELLPAVYAELRRLAAALTVRLPPGQTFLPTALVQEAYLKLVRDRVILAEILAAGRLEPGS